MPFEVPENWEWTTLENICSKIGSGSTPRGSNYSYEGIPFFRSQNVHNNGLCYDDIKYIDDETHQCMISTEVHPGDVLLNITGGSLGRCAVVPSTFDIGNVSQHVCILRPILVISEYLHAFILSGHFHKNMKVSGSGREGLPKYNLEKMVFPLPPFDEQARIVNQVQNLMYLIDDINANRDLLEKNIYQYKQEVLDLAISGKLNTQLSTDIPALEILKAINPSYSATDNRHYENLPDSWEEVELGDVCQLFDGEKVRGKEFINLDVKYLRGSKDGSRLSSGKYVPENALMILVDGENSGEVFTTPHEGYQGSTFKQLRISSELNRDYVLLLIQRSRELLKDNKVGSAIPHLNKKLFKQIHVPIPPYDEQSRIVRVVQDAMNKLDEILADL